MRQVAVQYLDFGVFFVCQILTAGFSVDFHAVFALFDHFGQDGGDFGIVGFGAFVHFKLFDGGVDEADGAEGNLVFGAHRGFHVFGKADFQAHDVLAGMSDGNGGFRCRLKSKTHRRAGLAVCPHITGLTCNLYLNV